MRIPPSASASALCYLSLLVLGSLLSRTAMADSGSDLFESQIRPVLAGTCFQCHSDLKSGGTLRVDSRDALLKGGDSGPAIVAGKSDDSLLIQAIQRHEGVSAMPPEKDKALRPDQIAAFVTWINAGANWPEKTAKFEATKHWAFEPIQKVTVPTIQNELGALTNVDRFVRAKQEAIGVHPASPADKLSLIRRATYDLTGLPPTPDEIDAFARDTSPQAFEAVVERLLKSNAYGERWGRHWLDIVRYADTAGETADYPVPVAWRFRNYVIDSFNADKPYDEFVREQIAGDIMALQEPRSKYAERATATGYLAISRRFGFDSENYHHLTIQDTIDTLGQSVLGLSLGCARCHDHKFDPVSINDYYGLYGIFESSSYSFPGAEQKPRTRSMMPLLPPDESKSKWNQFDSRIATLARTLSKQSPGGPPAVLRSVQELDGDFEMQAPAAGGSRGVLVGPWLWDGAISASNGAQSPFKNVYPLGKLGTQLATGGKEYRLSRALYPRRTPQNCRVLNVNLDFRVAAAYGAGMHRFWMGTQNQSPAVEILISSDGLSVRRGGQIERCCPVKPNQWQNLQLTLDLEARTYAGSISAVGEVSSFPSQPFASGASGIIDVVGLNSYLPSGSTFPSLEIDNLGIQESPLPSINAPTTNSPEQPVLDVAAINEQLKKLIGLDGDAELQMDGASLALPWAPGPNSVVKISAESQSPFQNLFAPGKLGIRMPNRAEYDGYMQALPTVWKSDSTDRLFASFDFRCASDAAGGVGSWRFYLGHNPGASAAIELYFNANEFVRRSGDAKDVVSALKVGEWYQVQLSLNLKEKTYTGLLVSANRQTEFAGALATGWDGILDYMFIDCFGPRPGVRPALDTDNFTIAETPLGSSSTTLLPIADGAQDRRKKVLDLRKQLVDFGGDMASAQQEMNTLLANGPCEMTYGVVEGTPHNARIQLRGEPDKPGAEVPRGFIKALGGGSLPSDSQGSGRLQLAQWITQPDNPLTARVMVNRIWQQHFGTGLVKTSNDFGIRGLKPSNPDLLDYLATEFIQSGWSIKAMHRLLMHSAVYQQSTQPADRVDPSMKVASAECLASFPRRRLTAEEIRDSILAVSGQLDPVPGQAHPFPSASTWGYSQHGPFSAVYDHNKRSVYLMTTRLKRHPFLALFDGADPNTTTAERTATTVPTQSLFFLNDPFVHAKAGKCAERLLSASTDETQQVDMANRLTIGRLPTDVERTEAFDFLRAYRAELTALGQDQIEMRALAAYVRTLFGCNEFLHLD